MKPSLGVSGRMVDLRKHYLANQTRASAGSGRYDNIAALHFCASLECVNGLADKKDPRAALSAEFSFGA